MECCNISSGRPAVECNINARLQRSGSPTTRTSGRPRAPSTSPYWKAILGFASSSTNEIFNKQSSLFSADDTHAGVINEPAEWPRRPGQGTPSPECLRRRSGKTLIGPIYTARPTVRRTFGADRLTYMIYRPELWRRHVIHVELSLPLRVMRPTQHRRELPAEFAVYNIRVERVVRHTQSKSAAYSLGSRYCRQPSCARFPSTDSKLWRTKCTNDGQELTGDRPDKEVATHNPAETGAARSKPQTKQRLKFPMDNW